MLLRPLRRVGKSAVSGDKARQDVVPDQSIQMQSANSIKLTSVSARMFDCNLELWFDKFKGSDDDGDNIDIESMLPGAAGSRQQAAGSRQQAAGAAGRGQQQGEQVMYISVTPASKASQNNRPFIACLLSTYVTPPYSTLPRVVFLRLLALNSCMTYQIMSMIQSIM